MKKMQMSPLSLLSLMTLALLVGPGRATDAKAEIRVNATLRTPNARVHVSNTPSQHYHRQYAGFHPIRPYRYYRIDERDRKIAHRLAWYTGAPARDLIHLKRRGYVWFEIGRWLHVPRPVVRAAMGDRSWKRFIRSERRLARFGPGPYPKRRAVLSIDDDFYDD